jgi:hypothetical protein
MLKPAPQEEIKKENPDQKESKTVSNIVLEVTSDAFSVEEREDVVKIVRADVEYGEEIQEEYVAQKELDLKHYHGAAPSILEGLTKKKWHSDRNLGLARAIADSYQATLLATAWTPESINLVATQSLEIDNRQNQEKFIKWGMGKHEANMGPETYDFIHNRITVGNSAFKIYRKTWTEWVDKRIPVRNKSTNKITKYEIKTEKVKMSRGVIENIPDIDDLLMPEYGKNVQELPFFIQILHLDGEKVLDLLERKVFKPKDKEDYKNKLYNHAYKEKKRVLGEEKLNALKITESSMSDTDIRRLTIDLYEWYGFYTKDGKTEKYRMIVDLTCDEFLSGKPIRKINRSGKIPFVVGSLSREPGMMRGISLMQTIAPVVNAFNNIFNQKSDFQYISNCPFGFHNPDEGFTKQLYELEPGVSFPVSGDPQKAVYFPNLQRSMAWAESDMRILFEVLERLTGAATFFQTNSRGVTGTATRDMLIDKNSETRFGLWVFGLQRDICEAISMWFELYQDYPPPNLAERVVGVDGKQLFRNLSIDSLRGDTDVQMTPDVVSGSKAYRKELQLWAFGAAQQTVWLNPQINPQGNYQLCADTFKEVLGLSDNEVKRYLGEQPKSQFNPADMDDEWYRFMNGEDFDPPEGETAMAQQHLLGHYKQKEEKFHQLPEEYRPIFEMHVYKTLVNSMKFMKNVQTEALSNRLAAATVMSGDPNMLNRGAQPGQQAQVPMASSAPGQTPAQQQPAMQPAGVPKNGTV